jgi:hypothetical protein
VSWSRESALQHGTRPQMLEYKGAIHRALRIAPDIQAILLQHSYCYITAVSTARSLHIPATAHSSRTLFLIAMMYPFAHVIGFKTTPNTLRPVPMPGPQAIDERISMVVRQCPLLYAKCMNARGCYFWIGLHTFPVMMARVATGLNSPTPEELCLILPSSASQISSKVDH